MRGYTGGLMEQEIFGNALNNEELERLKSIKMRMSDALEAVRNHQEGEDPSDPETQFANDLHASIADMLNLEDYSDLKFYTAVGSVVDRMGVDAFFDFKDQNGKTITVTLDVTMNPNKADGWRADVIILMPSDGLDPKLDKVAYREKIKEVTEKIVAKYYEKIKYEGTIQ